MTTTSQPPEQTRPGREFLRIDDLARDALVALNQKDITQYPAITKWAIQRFIEECMSVGGQFKEFFKNFATYSVDYVTNETLSRDPEKRDEQLRTSFKRYIQVARMADNVWENFPQIFIQDGGYNYVPSSLGGFSEGFATGDDLGSQNVRVTDDIMIPIEITCAALKQQTCEDLAAFMSAIFGQLGQKFTVNYLLKPAPNDQRIYWEVRLPLPHRMSVKTNTPLHTDPKDQVWTVTCSLECWFENSAYVYYRNDPRFQLTEQSGSLSFPDRIKVGTTVPVSFHYEPAISDVVSSDRRIAIVYKTNTHYIVKAKKLGNFTLQVMQFKAPEGPTVLLEQDVEVVVR